MRRASLVFAGVVLFTVITLALGSTYGFVQQRRAFWPRLNDGEYSVQSFALHPADQPRDIPWVRRVMGDFSCGTLLYRPAADADGSQLRLVQKLYPEATIWGWPNDPHLPQGIKPVAENRAIGDFIPAPDDPRATSQFTARRTE